jgi:uncharacterized protein
MRRHPVFKRIIGFLVAALATSLGATAVAQVKEIPWGTSAVGSAGHKALVALAEVLNREMPAYRVTVQPTPGAIVSVKGYALGKFEGYYGADIAFYELANDTARFKGFKSEMKRQPVQSFWAFTIEVGTAIHSRDRGKIKSWRDLSGKQVFTGPLPWDTRAQLERAYAALGVKHVYKQVDLTAVGSLMQSGGIDAFNVYTNGEATVAPWITEASLAADWAALNPSEEEIAALRKAGFAITEVKPAVFKRDVHADKVILLPFYYGFHVGMDVPEEDVYRMLQVIEKNAATLARTDPGFAQIAANMPELQKRGVQSSIEFVPVHPGLARYMREKGVWDAQWDDRIAKK